MAKRSFLILFLATTMLARIAGTSSGGIQLATVVITVVDATSNEAISGAYVNVGGVYHITDETGSVVFRAAVASQITYTITCEGYHSLSTGYTVKSPSDGNGIVQRLNPL